MAPPYSSQTGRVRSVFREPVAHPLQLAAAMFALYAIATVLNPIVFPVGIDPANVSDILRMLLHPLGAGLVTWGLLHRARWARWVGLGFALSVLAAGVLAISVFEHGDIYWLPPSTYQLFFVSGLLSVGAAVALLLAPSARAGVSAILVGRGTGLPLRDDQRGRLSEAGAVRSLMKTHW